MDVMTADFYPSNAELIVACRELKYLDDEWSVLDPTYGYGTFWNIWEPRYLHAYDLDPRKCPYGTPPGDFTKMEHSDASYDAVVFDPPYKLNGTPSQDEVDERYGVHEPARWQDRMQLCYDGITECVRVLKPKGYLLIKCMDQVCSGKKRWQTREFADHAESLGCELVDMLHILVTPRPQPEGRRQVHSRQNYSTMLIMRKRTNA